MKEKDLYHLNGEILSSYKNKKFKETIKFCEEYLSVSKSGISNLILYYYARSLFLEGRTEESIVVYNILKKWYPYKNVDFDLGLAYMHVGNLKAAAECLSKYAEVKSYHYQCFFQLAKCYLLMGEAELALNYFKLYLRKACPEDIDFAKAQKYVKKINNHLNYGNMVDVDIHYFKEKENHLEVGHVVYIKGKENKHPILIYKIEEDKIWGMPIASVFNDGIQIPQKDCLNLDYPIIVGVRVVSFQEKDIIALTEKISKKHVRDAIFNAYNYWCRFKEELRSNDVKQFVQEIKEKLNVQKGDIIEALSVDLGIKQGYFYILDKTEEGYSLLPMTYGQEFSLTMEEPIFVEDIDILFKHLLSEKNQKQIEEELIQYSRIRKNTL